MNNKSIKIFWAAEHNLKNIDVVLPIDKMTVITGLSWSGKSTLAFDTIYAEGQRRYVESLSTYARQFLGVLNKPKFDRIEWLSPAIAIDQKTTNRNPRSTVGTITEIYDYLRLLYAKVGDVFCYKCHKPISHQSPSHIVDQILAMPEGTKIMIMAPLVTDKKGEHQKIIEKIKKDGFVRLRVDGEMYTIAEEIKLEKNKKHTIDVVVDRLVVTKPKTVTLSSGEIMEIEHPDRIRFFDSVELALKLGEGMLKVFTVDTKTEKQFSEKFACIDCGISFSEVSPRNFSFNSPHGACPKCQWLGIINEFDENLIIPNPDLSIAEGAIHPWNSFALNSWHYQILKEVGKIYNFKLTTPFKKLTAEQKKIIFQGVEGEKFSSSFQSLSSSRTKISGRFEYKGVINYLKEKYSKSESDLIKVGIEAYMVKKTCPECNGKKLRKESLAIKINNLNIIDLCQQDIDDNILFFEEYNKKENWENKEIITPILREIISRLTFLKEVGLSYLSLDRTARSLSGGEAQRIRLVTQIGSNLRGILYVLDEPSIGLHQRDNNKLIATLRQLQKNGNTVIVVEHDLDTIMGCDYVIDMWPSAGKYGGEIVFQGTPQELLKSKKSLTGQYLRGEKNIPIPSKRNKGNGKFIEVIGASENNLKNINVKIPLGCLVGVSGVSGSGKSSLIHKVLVRYINKKIYRSKATPGKHKAIKWLSNIDKIISITQDPIGRTPRSNTATYTGIFDEVRKLFANMPDSKLRWYKAGRFSFNVKGGRCEYCKGDGYKKVEMHFLSDVYVKCEECNGTRYNREVLDILYRGKNISQILEMTVLEAYDFFKNIPVIRNKLELLMSVGLEYINLGQPATTLSGGEAQRIKLSSELSKKATGKTIYILDEPTTGLHLEDIAKLIKVLQELVNKGNSVIIIEHNLDLLKVCDHLIDIGPEGGNNGWTIVAQGTPEEVSQVPESYTAKYLKKILKI